jgi:PPOX class probable F420-dependent enzyme
VADRLQLAREFLAKNHRAVLITRRADGSPQSSPVTAGVDGEGRAIVSSRRMLAKVRNLRNDPQASLCVVTEAWFGPWAQLDGRAEIIELPDALELLVEAYRSIRGEHPDWDEYRVAMQREERVLIRIELERAVTRLD